MRVKFEFNVIDQEISLLNGHGETEIKNPVMIYAQIPIEKDHFIKLQQACKEQKITIYDLLYQAVSQDPDEIYPY